MSAVGHDLPVEGSGGTLLRWMRPLRDDRVIALLGVLTAVAAIVDWRGPALAAAGLFVAWWAVARPWVGVASAFLGILLDAQGVLDLKVAGLPLTLGKVSVLFALGAWVLHGLLTHHRPLVKQTPVSGGLYLAIFTMVVSLVGAKFPALGYMDIAGFTMLTVMLHLIYTAVPDDRIPLLARFMSILFLGFMLWTLLFGRAQDFYVTLDHAWQQRTSGAFGEPNVWSVALLVTSPILLAFLQHDRWPLSRLLFFGVAVAYPACIFQAMSRAGLVAFVLVLPGLVYLLRRRWMLMLAAVLVLVPFIPFVINVEAMLLRYQTIFDPTLEADLGHVNLQERSNLLKYGVLMFLEHPVFGVGVGSFRPYADAMSSGLVWKIAHNSYVNVAAEQGLVGLAAHAVLGWQAVSVGWRMWTQPEDEAGRDMGLGYLVALGGFGAMAATLNLATFAIAWFMLAFGMRVGLSWGVGPASGDDGLRQLIAAIIKGVGRGLRRLRGRAPHPADL